MGRSDRAHAGFHCAGYLLEDLASLAPTENLRSDYFVLGHERHGRLVPTLAINPSGRPSGCAMHNEGIANGLAALAHLMRRASRCVAPQKTWKSLGKAGLSGPENKRVFRSGNSPDHGLPTPTVWLPAMVLDSTPRSIP